ncbi:uncharacterized protein HMPREF1541_04056 [Cyphellophora europaea CBS 101466]|uniref:Uncharacterized protein n=1 Tax=Cyphellophora europaea (strain CBS 101466) TaxID=1220924 RepID=W2S0A1_CYPE1|nr:uncharacterized protein HMPREF1541_04056 [Cyphellophora europaea CBS 101466]ETN42117.1 hypothetical protein HMPREF1541_04056 [Cyphellophora europaea CBS 101466]
MSASRDGSEDVDQFLARIASLSKKTDSDADQARRSEEQMMLAKRERQARRAERARSISPVKTGPAAPLSLPSTPGADRRIDPPVSLTPRSRAQTLRRPDESPSRTGRPQSPLSVEQDRSLPQTPQDKPDSPSLQPVNATALSRSGTLSWQQRPTSRGIGSVRSRPLSGSRGSSRGPAENAPTTAEKGGQESPSRKDIAAALGSKDPAWFRQTQDRGIGSAAYRKSEQDDVVLSARSSQGMRLPGMASGTTEDRFTPTFTPSEPAKEHSESELFGKRASVPQSPRKHPAAAYVSNPGPAPSLSPTEPSLPHEEHVLDHGPSDQENSSGQPSSTFGSMGRPPSPTKGLGGFVQSAMMRRNDSVSKRWSVQAHAGLKRGDSVASNRPVFNPPTPGVPSLGHARTLSRDPRLARDGTASPQSSSRPSSSHAEEASIQPSIQKSKSEPHGLVAPPSNRASVPSQPAPADGQEDSKLSRSPSKTMDPRRWSPTKASWLESALSKPESPRFSPTKEEPPAWKIGLQRSKSQKDLADTESQPTSFDPVNTGGLLRSPTLGATTKPLDLQPKPSPVLSPTKATLDAGKSTILEDKPPVEAETLPETASKLSVNQTRKFADEITPSSDSALQHTQKANDGKPDPRESMDKKPPALKPKPQTPPKTDFRANLKSRQTGSATANSDEPEFKSVFGKLKKAETKNYVAPDTLKDNITRGKSGLNITGGPQPRKRVDEFKESILAQKEAMKAGAGTAHKRSDSRDASPEKPAQDLPEALRRRNTLHKSKISTDKPIISTAELPTQQPQPPIKSRNLSSTPIEKEKVSPKPVDKPLEKSLTKGSETVVEKFPESLSERASAAATPVPHSKPLESKPIEVHKEPETTLSRTTTKTSESSSHGLAAGTQSLVTGGALQLKKTTSGGLAARLNPALAGLIARGNSPKPSGESGSAGEASSDMPMLVGNANTGKTEDPANLTHMTKGRAKGPKRRAPKADPPAEQEAAVSMNPTTLLGEVDIKNANRSPVKSNFTESRTAFVTRPLTPKVEAVSREPKQKPVAKLRDAQHPKTPPAVSSKSPELRRISNQSPVPEDKVESLPVVATKSPELRRISNNSPVPIEKAEPLPPKTSPKKNFNIATDGTVREATPSKSTAAMPLTPSRSKLNSPRPQQPSDEAAGSQLGDKKPKPPGLGLQFGFPATAAVKTQELTPPPERDLKTSALVDTRKPNTAVSPTRQALEAFFTPVPRSDEKADFDTETILNVTSAAPERPKTLNSQVFEITGDGKKTLLSPGQEHVFFEESMYLVVHTFEASAKKVTEVYIWAGDAISASALEDAQIFCRKVARENSAKLLVMKQGKESGNFFSAVGGILVTRKNKSAALYMLCGRRHAGHVAFDEVGYSSEALCSGFPFLISAKFGKLYLWKGQGSGADEIGAARLIGMDLGLTGEIEEVSEGKEPAAFWESFSAPNAKTLFKPSDIWAMRSMDEKNGFPCKLYRLEFERPKSSGGFWGLRATSPSKPSNKATLTEIPSFTQADLTDDGVFVLDAWASIYVYVSPIPGSQAKAAEFSTALHIAQEIAVLTPSMQDRALLPSCEVVFGPLPREVRAAFRKFVPENGIDGEAKVFEVAEVLSALD